MLEVAVAGERRAEPSMPEAAVAGELRGPSERVSALERCLVN